MRWPILIVILALVAVAVLLFSQQPAILSPSAAPVSEPVEGGVYTEALIGTMGRLNPVLDYYNNVDRDVDRLLFSGLLRYDERGLLQGDLADSWGVSKDGLIYNFSLRANAVWHDGQPVSSDDVLYTIQVMRDENAPLPEDWREFWNQVDVSRLNDRTIQFRLPEPFAPFLDYLTFRLLPAHLVGELSLPELVDAHFNLSPVGSGPYRFERMIVEEGQIVGLSLTAFEGYYAQKPFVSEMVFRYYPSANDALQAYDQGEVMGISQVSLDILPEVLREPELNLHTGRLPQLTLILFNLDNPAVPFFQEVAVRRALMLGLNRQWIIDRLLGGQAIPANGPILPGTWAYYDGIERLGYDPEQAIALLKEAGYTYPAQGGDVRAKDGLPLEFELLYPDDDDHAAIAEAIRANWQRLGVSVLLKAVPYDELVADQLDQRQHQAALVDLSLSRSPDPDPYPFWHQAQKTNGQNYAGWDDRSASEYLEQARITLDIGERARLYRNFQIRFMQELPALPLFYPMYTYAVSAEVQGVSMGPLFAASDRFNTVTNWFLVSKRTAAQAVTPDMTLPTATP